MAKIGAKKAFSTRPNPGVYVHRITRSTILICKTCITKFVKTRDRQTLCLRCIFKAK